MIALALVLFALAAVGGVTLLSRAFRREDAPGTLVLGHGVFAAAALALALFGVFGGSGIDPATSTLVYLALGVLGAAALGGLGLLLLHRSRGELPLPVAIVHGLLGVGGVLLLFLWSVSV